MYDSGWSGHSFFGMGLGGGLLMLLFWIVIILGIVALARWLLSSAPKDTKRPGNGQSRALDILDERYARGEIDEDEYQEKRRHLQ
ncbi:MAG: SHOCT domain-containing protein [Gammaproteobacteria bacterium]|mgnify:FL=1|nr:SHOCT domain-containing protein [Gammaproteobacteria bacterium]